MAVKLTRQSIRSAPKPEAAPADEAATRSLALEGLPAPALIQLEPDALELNPENPARSRAQDDLSELEASIRAHGILQPPIARRVGNRIQVVAGERRVLAARAIGLPVMPVLLFDGPELDDRRALEVALVENLHRRDMSPLDEARAYGVLRDRGLRLEDIQTHVGRSIAHVHRRLLLVTLAPEALRALEAGALTLGAAEQIARLSGHEAHREVLRDLGFDMPALKKGVIRSRWGADLDGVTALGARRSVEQFTRELSRAPWDLGDQELVPEAGACLACPKRSGAQATMFAAADASKEDACMDTECWARKLKAHGARVVAAAKAGGAKVLPPKESAKLYPMGTTYLASAKHVDLDSPCDLPGRRGSWRAVLSKVLPEVPQVVATDSDGGVHTIAEKKEVLAVARAAGIVKPDRKAGRTSQDARRANELAEQRRATAFADAVLDAALSRLHEDDSVTAPPFVTWQAFMPLFLGRSIGRALSDQKRELVRRWSRKDGWSLPRLIASGFTGLVKMPELVKVPEQWKAHTVLEQVGVMISGLEPAGRTRAVQLLMLELAAVDVEFGFDAVSFWFVHDQVADLVSQRLPSSVASLAFAAGLTVKDLRRIRAQVEKKPKAARGAKAAGGRKAKKAKGRTRPSARS